MSQTLLEPEAASATRLELIDCDIHPVLRSTEALRPYLPRRWRDELDTFGFRSRGAFLSSPAYPKATPALSRRDAWPPGGLPPGSDLAFMRQQHLDFYGIEYGVMNPLSPSGQGNQNDELSAAMAFATNEYQLENWNRREPRLKASVVIPYEDAEPSVKEINRRAGDRRFNNHGHSVPTWHSATPAALGDAGETRRCGVDAGNPSGVAPANSDLTV